MLLIVLLCAHLLASPPPAKKCQLPADLKEADAQLREVLFNRTEFRLYCLAEYTQNGFQSEDDMQQHLQLQAFHTYYFHPGRLKHYVPGADLRCFLLPSHYDFQGFLFNETQPLKILLRALPQEFNDGRVILFGGLDFEAFAYLYPVYQAHPRTFGVWLTQGTRRYMYLDEHGAGYVLLETQPPPNSWPPQREWVRFEDFFARQYGPDLTGFREAEKRWQRKTRL